MKNLRFAICDLRLLATVVLLCCSVPSCAHAQLRQIDRTNDVRLLPVSQDTLYWFTGETVQYNIYARNGRAAVTISNAAVPMWYVTDSTLTNYFVMNTGTVISATNGHVRFTLTPTYSALTSKIYQSAAIVYFAGPTNPSLQLVVDRTAADVRKSFSYAGTYRGPITSTNWTLDGNTPVIGTFWTGNATGIFAAISNLLPTSSGGGVDTNAVNGLINASTNTSARLASNVWAAADSTTNYALRSNGGISPVYGWQTSGGYDGSSFVNNFGQRIDFRTTNSARDVFNIYAVDTNQIPNNRGGVSIWAYGLAHTSSYSAGTRSPYLALGLHSVTQANQGVIIFTVARGTNDTQHDTEFWNGSMLGGSKKVLTLSAEGHVLVHTGSITAAAGFIGDGSSITNIGSTSLALSVLTNITARLASNVWAVADSTTNYARRVEAMTNNSFSINGVPVGSGSNATVSGGSGADTNSVGRIATNAVSQATNFVLRTGDTLSGPIAFSAVNSTRLAIGPTNGDAWFGAFGALDTVASGIQFAPHAALSQVPVMRMGAVFNGADASFLSGPLMSWSGIGNLNGDLSAGDYWRLEYIGGDNVTQRLASISADAGGSSGASARLVISNGVFNGDGGGVTNLAAANIAAGGILPALSGANLTNLPASTSVVLKTGSTMSGPLTNTAGFFGNGAGLTGIVASASAAPFADVWEVANTITTQNLAGSTWSNINFDTYASGNPGRNYNITNDTLTFTSTGMCFVTAAARVFNMSATNRTQMALYKNTVLYRQGIVLSASTNTTPTLAVNFWNDSATNIYTVAVYQEDAVARTLTGGGAASGYFIWASGYRLRNAGE